FHPLGKEQIRSIARIQIEYLRGRLQQRDIDLQITDAALDKLGEAGFDPVYGARPLKRAIQERLENPLAQAILAGEYGEGNVIEVDVDGDELVFKKQVKGSEHLNQVQVF
ncbi:MAG TPA: type VI secretion system ATPase TssH, partial [Chromatiales bacterium]|nr:type VI secretion system ATPase TssH [Chromatiales bacterium]